MTKVRREQTIKTTKPYKKGQLIHGLNDKEILAEIIRELAKQEENKIIKSEQVLAWAKRVETQKNPISNYQQLKWNKRLW